MASNYCRFLWEKCLKGEEEHLLAFKEDEMQKKKKNDIYREILLVDAGESVGQKEGHTADA